jgi:hypothetical protein
VIDGWHIQNAGLWYYLKGWTPTRANKKEKPKQEFWRKFNPWMLRLMLQDWMKMNGH